MRVGEDEDSPDGVLPTGASADRKPENTFLIIKDTRSVRDNDA